MTTNHLKTAVIIIGAGPAGAGVSIYLTMLKIPHVIIEKECFPRDKVCGDAISGKTQLVLRKANPEWLNEIFSQPERFMPSHGGLFVAPDGKVLSIPYSRNRIPDGQAPGFTTTRLIFDEFLFNKLASTYSTIYQNASVNEIVKHEDGVSVSFTVENNRYEVRAPLIVGADGDKSMVRKTFLQDASSSKSYCVALRAYYSGVTGLHPQNFIELHYIPEILPGYFWIFPLPDGMANVGVGILSERIRQKKINLREQMLHVINYNPGISHRFANAKLEGNIRGWGLPMGMERRPVSGDHFLLTGDAASLVDPFTGEGIGNALYSGMLAAYAIEKSLHTKKYDAMTLKENYDDVLYKSIGEELKISAMLQRVTHYPRLLHFIINKAYKSPTLNKAISGMFTGVDLRKLLRQPSFYAKVLFNR